MIPQASNDCWYYATDKKRVGPVSLKQLRSLLVAGVLKPEDMVFQEGTIQWRPLAGVLSSPPRAMPINTPLALVLAGGVVVILAAFLVCGLVATLLGPSVEKDVENLGPVAEISREPDQTKGTNQEATKEPALPGSKEPQGPRPQERDDPNPERDAPKQAADAAHSVGKDVLTIEGGDAKVLPASKRLTLVYQLGHTGPVGAVAFSPDGKQVLTGSADKTARLWDVASGRELGAFKGGFMMSVAFSPDGKQVLVGEHAGDWRLWDAASGKILEPYGKPPVAFSPDGKLLFTGGWPTARLWDTASGKEIWKLDHKDFRVVGLPQGGCAAVAFSPDGKQMLLGGAGMAQLWDTANAKEIRRFPVDKGTINSVGFSPDGKQVLAASTVGPTVRLWDVASGVEIRAFQADGGGKFLFSPDGKRLLTGNRLWDAASGKEIRVLQGTPVAFSPDSKQVLTDFGSSARLWDADTGMAIRSFEGGHAALSPDGKQVLTASSWTDGLKKETRHLAKLWDTATGKEILAFRGQAIVIASVAFSADGKQVVMGSDDMTARLWDLPSGKKTQTFQGHTGTVHAVAFSPDGKQVLTGGDSTARLWDVAGGKEIRAIKSGGVVAFSPGGKELLIGRRLWDAASGKELRSFTHAKKDPYNLDFVQAVAVSPDGKLVLTGSYHSGANLWNAEDGKWICRFADDQPTPKDPLVGRFALSVPHVAFSPDGRQVVTGTVQGYVRLWNTANTEKLVAICDYSGGKGGQGPKLTCLAFAPNGSVFIGCNDGTVRLWREQGNGLVPRELRGHTGGITSVAVSPDGKQAVTASKDTTVRLWDVASGLELCQMLGFRDGSWAVVTRDNYYMASKGALQALAFRFGERTFAFNQFDVKFNRPDKVIERIGLGSPEMVAAYGHAYQKRLKRTSFTADMLNDDFHVPEITATAGIKFITHDKTLKLKIKAGDSKYLLDRLNIDVNGVPLQGTGGISLRKQAAKTWEQEIEVELSAGNNKIDVSVLNEKGAESLKETITIQCDAPAAKPNLYVVAVGVSDYEDARFRLTYADKDARDLADWFESKRDRFGEVKVQRLLNRDATRENILKTKDFLKGSQVDDLVVLFFAGHGLLDSKLDYYYATADIDFKNPASRGLPYEAIEDLLDGIRARKKLLLMDTCHSGELDKDDVQIVRSEKQAEGEIKVRSIRGLDFGITPKVGLNNSYQLLQEMFADLRRGTGAVVIASAGGAEYALESAAWKNGVFTHALLRGLKGEADRDKNGRVQVSELRDFVEQEVRRLTQNRQAPTARRENLVVDFMLD